MRLERSKRWASLILLGVVAGPLSAGAQPSADRPWLDPLLVHEPFTETYRHLRDREVAAAMLRDDPLSLQAASLLLDLREYEPALDVLRRIVESRPDQARQVLPLLQSLEVEVGRVGERARTLRGLVERAPQSDAGTRDQGPGPLGRTTVDTTRRWAEDEVDAMTLARLVEAEQAVEAAGEVFRRGPSLPGRRDVERAYAPALMAFREIADRDRGRAGQYALLALANAEFESGRLRDALKRFRELEARYPHAETAWVAAMRVAQLTQGVGDASAAADLFVRVRTVYGHKPGVSALAGYYEARAYEAQARWADALVAYRACRATWPVGAPRVWRGLDWRHYYASNQFIWSQWPASHSRDDVEARIATLAEAVVYGWRLDAERASWLVEHGRPGEAAVALKRALRKTNVDGARKDIRLILHRAEFDKATASLSMDGALTRHGVRSLKRLCEEPMDEWVGVACAVQASVVAVAGREREARAALHRTLSAWAASQRPPGGAPQSTPLASVDDVTRDALEVRDLVFAVSRTDEQLAADASRNRSAPFVLMPGYLSVTTSGTDAPILVASRPPAGPWEAIHLSGDGALGLWGSVERLSGCADGPRSKRLDALWNGAVGFAPWYCSLGWSGYTRPLISSVEFMNPERTRAHVVVSAHLTGGGGESIVEKVSGVWTVTGTGSVWEY